MNTTNIKKRSFFTLLELLVAMAVFSVMMTVLMQYFGSAQRVTVRSAQRVEVFEKARIALELISRDLQSFYFDSSYREVIYDAKDNNEDAISGGLDTKGFKDPLSDSFYNFKPTSISFMSASQNLPQNLPNGIVQDVGLVTYAIVSGNLVMTIKGRIDDTTTTPGSTAVEFGTFTDSNDSSSVDSVDEIIISDVESLSFSYEVSDPNDSSVALSRSTIKAVRNNTAEPIFPELVTISLTLKQQVSRKNVTPKIFEYRTFTKMAFIGSNRDN